jgi:hypothetical protein
MGGQGFIGKKTRKERPQDLSRKKKKNQIKKENNNSNSRGEKQQLSREEKHRTTGECEMDIIQIT